jgi:Flp pilus assembly secretin CpaC
MFLAVAGGVADGQQTPVPAQPQANAPAATSGAATTSSEPLTTQSVSTAETRNITTKDRRRATKLYFEATKLFESEQFEAAMKDYEQAAALDPANTNYTGAAKVARSHAVTALIQTAAKARMRGDGVAERAALQRAAELDPLNLQVAEHLHEMADDAVAGRQRSLYDDAANGLGDAPVLTPAEGKHSFHQRSDRKQLIQAVFKAYGIEASVDQSVSGVPVKLDLDDASFAQATQAVNLLTETFTVPLDAHRVLVAKDTHENRQQYTRQELETVYLGGLTAAEMTEIGNLAKNVFMIQQVAVEQSAGTLTVRAPTATLNALNATLQQLLDGHSQVLLEVRVIQLAHTSQRETGIQPPQQFTAFNVYAEEQSILNANQALVQEIISSGLASPGDTLAILGILLASGQVSSSLFQNGIALFGGGLTLSGISPGPATVNLSLNSSDSRELDQIELRLGDGEKGTLKDGMRYPIMTASYSNLGTSGLNIPGLTTAGNSSSLSSLLSSLSSSATNIPQVQYQDLGLTLEATPRVIRSGDVALTLDLKITALAGSSINGVPILNNRSYSGAVTLKEGSGVVIASEVDKEESRALSGFPGISEIPGLNQASSNDVQRNYATLLVVMIPHVIRGTQAGGRSPMMRIERGSSPAQ